MDPKPDTNIHCYYRAADKGWTDGYYPEFGISASGFDREACETMLQRIVNRKQPADRCFTDHATGEEPK